MAIAPVPVVVRVLARYSLGPKGASPAVVALDGSRRFAVALLEAHRGANALAERVAHATGAIPVITTSAEAADAPVLDAGAPALPDEVPARLQSRLNAGAPLVLAPRDGLRLPSRIAALARSGTGEPVILTVSEDRGAPRPRLVPRTLVVGVGLERRASAGELTGAVRAALEGAGLAEEAVATLATIERRRLHPAVLGAPWPVVGLAADELAAISVPTPSAVVDAAVGTPSVAEAAALAVAGPDARLVLPKRILGAVTVAIARRDAPLGHLALVGLGPGAPDLVTPRAQGLLASADLVVGYGPYVEQAAPFLSTACERLALPIGAEQERVDAAIAAVHEGRRVALLASGDPGIYALASLALERGAARVPLAIAPGVSAALAAAARAGAPLGHDHAIISLSDLLTPWETIAARLEAAARADLVVVLYNPRSHQRTTPLEKALAILQAHRPPTTPVLVARNVERPTESIQLTSLAEVVADDVDMATLLVVGHSASRVAGGLMLTPRGYRQHR